jgi:TP901 family phage tail tape measure protein
VALGTREIMLVLRARDEASRALMGLGRSMGRLSGQAKANAQSQMMLGGALMGLGTGIATMGGAGLAFMNKATSAAITYNQQAAKTLTQVDAQGKSLERVKEIGRTVADVIPVPFEETQTALYDIFSSMDVTMSGSKKLLTEFSRAAVAGQVDVQDASRATIGIMNAYHLKVQDVTKVNDTMFQLVRKGVGTYAEFAAAIGRATPSAARAGGTFQELAGMMAFSTRNGLSAAMAATSAARAYDAISNPKTLENFASFGKIVQKAVGPATARQLGITGKEIIKLTDKAGNFRPMAAIMTDLGKKMRGLSESARSDVLKSLFFGSGGTIQAMRFMNLAVTNFDELNQRTKEMKQSAGVMDEAYDIMFKQPQTQVQLLSNKYMIMKTVIGDQLLPMKVALMKKVMELLDWWNNLDAGLRKNIVQWVAIGSALLVVVGVVLTVVGGFILLQGALALLGIGLAAILIPVAAVVAVIVLIAVVIWKWKPIKAFVIDLWSSISAFTVKAWNEIYGVIGPYVQAVWDFIVNVWGQIQPWIIASWNAIVAAAKVTWNAVVKTVQVVIQKLPGIIMGTLHTIGAVWSAFWNSNIVRLVKNSIGIAYEVIRITLQLMYVVFRLNFKLILAVVKQAWYAIEAAFYIASGLIRGIWKVIWFALGPIIKAAWGPIKKYIVTNFNAIMSATRDLWGKFRDYILSPLGSAASGIAGFIGNVMGMLNGFLGRVADVAGKIRGFLKKINPAEHFSPSIVEQADTGFKALTKVTMRNLSLLDRLTDAKTDKIRNQLRRLTNDKKLTPAQNKGRRAELQDALAEAQKQSRAIDTIRKAMGKFNPMMAGMTSGMAQLTNLRKTLRAAFKGDELTGPAKKLDTQLTKLIAGLAKRRQGLANQARGMVAAFGTLEGAMEPEVLALKNRADKLTDAWRDAEGNVPEAIQGLVDKLKQKADDIHSAMEDARKSLSGFDPNTPEIGKSLSGMRDVVKALDEAWKGMTMSADAKKLRAALEANITTLTNTRQGLVDAASGMVVGFNDITTAMDPTANGLAKQAKALEDSFDGEEIPASVQALIDTLNNKSKLIDDAMQDIQKGLKKLDPNDPDLASTLKSAQDLKAQLLDAWSGIEMTDAAKALAAALDGVINTVTTKIQQVSMARAGLVMEGKHMLDGLVGGIQASKSPLAQAASDMADAITKSFEGVEGGIDENTQKIIDGLKDRAADIQSFRDSLGKNLSAPFDLVSQFGSGASGSGIIKHLQKSLADMNKWADAVRQLSAQGINRGLLRQIIEAGPGSYGLVKGLLSAGTVPAVNALLDQAQASQEALLNEFENSTFTATPPQGYFGAPNSKTTGSNTNHIDVTVNTQEINPKAHAASLAWEFAQRVG